jgi:hypothetical protein
MYLFFYSMKNMIFSAADKFNSIRSILYQEFCRWFKEIAQKEQNIQLFFPFSFDAEGASDSIQLELIDQQSGKGLKSVLWTLMDICVSVCIRACEWVCAHGRELMWFQIQQNVQLWKEDIVTSVFIYNHEKAFYEWSWTNWIFKCRDGRWTFVCSFF